MRSERRVEEELRRQVEHIIDPRKCVHVKIPAELHGDMRIFGFNKKLSLQEMLIEFCQLIVDGDAYLHAKMDNLAKRKKERKLKKLTLRDSENIYDYIAGKDSK